MPQREILWNVPPLVMAGVYALSAGSVAWIVFWFYRRSRLWKRGTTSEPRNWLAGLARLVDYLAGHRKIGADRFAGIMHWLVFWGFIVLLIATTLVGIQHHFQLIFLTGWTYLLFSLAADLGGLAFCAGIGMALWRRLWRIEARLQRSRVHAAVLWLLLAIGVSGFVLEGARILAWDFPAFEVWSPIGYACALAMSWLGADSAVTLHLALWVLHAALVIVFFVAVPVTILKHILLGAYSVAFPAGRPGLLHAPAEPVAGAVDLPHLRALDWMQADACLTCGLCTQVCPAEAAGKPLSPRSVVLGLRAHLDAAAVPLTQQVADDALWSCTACNACDVACPINIHIVDKIVALRRGRVATGELPEPAAEALESTAQKFNPFGRANSARMEWASGLNISVARDDEAIELLYWVGCAGAFDPAGSEVARAMVRILNHARISFRVLGCAERCTGDPARRLGEEGLWRELADENRRTFGRHGVQTILTHCPHCFHALGNEYAALGPMPRVLHHTQWLREKLADGTLKVRAGVEPITFHDPCYLGRVNGETAAPRSVLDMLAPGRQVEMADHGQRSFCCGGGGGQIWLDVKGRTRVETIRAEHVEATGAATVATGCPFCRVMLEAGRGSLPARQGNWRVRDLAELVAERLD